jgi:CheY-like chemotaxis protein
MLQTQNVRVLLVDDDEFSQNIARQMLSTIGIKVRVVNSGVIALKAVEQGKYDMVFIDHIMPEMDGVETMMRIRALGGVYKDIVLVALTGSIGENAREKFIQQGFTDYLPKPIDNNELCKIARRHLPPDKIVGAVVMPESVVTKERVYSKTDLKLLNDFVNEKKDTISKVNQFLNAGDFEEVHRIAHNLKSAAGYFKKNQLQESAASLETSLGKNPPEFTAEQITTLEKDLHEAIADFEVLLISKGVLAETGACIDTAATDSIAQLSVQETVALLEELKPLLMNSDFSALEYTEKLKRVAGMEQVITAIENYDFDDAYSMLLART